MDITDRRDLRMNSLSWKPVPEMLTEEGYLKEVEAPLRYTQVEVFSKGSGKKGYGTFPKQKHLVLFGKSYVVEYIQEKILKPLNLQNLDQLIEAIGNCDVGNCISTQRTENTKMDRNSGSSSQ